MSSGTTWDQPLMGRRGIGSSNLFSNFHWGENGPVPYVPHRRKVNVSITHLQIQNLCLDVNHVLWLTLIINNLFMYSLIYLSTYFKNFLCLRLKSRIVNPLTTVRTLGESKIPIGTGLFYSGFQTTCRQKQNLQRLVRKTGQLHLLDGAPVKEVLYLDGRHTKYHGVYTVEISRSGWKTMFLFKDAGNM